MANSTTATDAAKILCGLSISNSIKNPIKDIDGNIILSEKERNIILIAHIFDLFESHGFKSIQQLDILTAFDIDCSTSRNEERRITEIAKKIDFIKKINHFFKNIPTESHDFFKDTFFFEKNLNPIKKTLIIGRCISNFKTIDDTFESITTQFNVIDKSPAVVTTE